jgi:hypothetical protein
MARKLLQFARAGPRDHAFHVASWGSFSFKRAACLGSWMLMPRR